jgi:hypothetical protein
LHRGRCCLAHGEGLMTDGLSTTQTMVSYHDGSWNDCWNDCWNACWNAPPVCTARVGRGYPRDAMKVILTSYLWIGTFIGTLVSILSL